MVPSPSSSSVCDGPIYPEYLTPLYAAVARARETERGVIASVGRDWPTLLRLGALTAMWWSSKDDRSPGARRGNRPVRFSDLD